MPVKPPSGRSEFDGVAEFYAAEIEPYLHSKEGERRAAVTNAAIIAAAFALLAAAFLIWGPLGEANLQIAILLGMIGAGITSWLLNRTRNEIAEHLLGRIATRMGYAYRQKPGRPPAHERMRALGLLPSHNIEHWEDEVLGERAGARFQLCEAWLRQRSSGKNRNVRTVFRGQLVVIAYPRRFLGVTVVRRDAGPLNALMKPRGGFSRVQLASPEFEKAFEAWSTDQVEARDLLDPIVLERFQALEKLFGGKKLRAAFSEGELLLALETGDRLNMGSMFRPLADPARVETILKEFDAIFDLIDVLIARVEKRLGGALRAEDVRPTAREK